MTRLAAKRKSKQGYTLTELLVALMVSSLAIASTLTLLQQSQHRFQREPEMASLSQNIRVGLNRIGDDLRMAGSGTPPTHAILWNDGGGEMPDELTIVYADLDVPVAEVVCRNREGSRARSFSHFRDIRWGNWARPALNPSPSTIDYSFNSFVVASFQQQNDLRRIQRESGDRNTFDLRDGGRRRGDRAGSVEIRGGRCGYVTGDRVTSVDPATFDPPQASPDRAYAEGMVLFAMESSDCNHDRQLGIIPLEVSGIETTSANGKLALELEHPPEPTLPCIELPEGFNTKVDTACAVIGSFRVIQYRIRPSADTPTLERKDWSSRNPWTPVAGNIENLQIMYAQGGSANFANLPSRPLAEDPNTWINRVRVTIFGRTGRANLQGATAGSADGSAHIRKAFSTTVTLRSQTAAAANVSQSEYN